MMHNRKEARIDNSMLKSRNMVPGRNMTIIVGDTIGLPVGYAPSTRTKYISSLLTMAGRSVEILLIKPSEPPGRVKNTTSKFMMNGVSVTYTCGTTTLSRNWFMRRLRSFYGLAAACYHIFSHRKNLKAVILYSRNIEIVIALGLLLKILHIPSVLELCEWPITQPAINFIGRIKKISFCRYALFFVDGAIYISQYIHKQIIDFEHANNRTLAKFHLPILCDTREFDILLTVKVKSNSILYCGNLSYRSLLERTLDIISRIHENNKNIHLTIVGSSDNIEDIIHLEKLIDSKGIAGNVTAAGYIDRSALLNLYKSAYAFLLPLEDDELSDARFPTKMAEYLLSGRPVVAPDTGEISFYLKKGISFMAPEHNDVPSFSTCLTDLLADSSLAERVGRAGKEVAKEFFDYRNYSKCFSQWIVQVGKI